MTREALRYFATMFATDRRMGEAKWDTQFPAYQFDSEAGAKPWWPPLSHVWRAGEACPDPQDGTARAAAWPEAWACLQRLHDEYRMAKALRTSTRAAGESAR
mgnify:CR=1 FL=1|jgi:hypothetical protein